MQTINFKKYVVAVLTILFMCSCTDAQTFVITDIVAPDNISKENVQKTRKKFIGKEINLLFSDNDVRMTIKIKDDKTESILLQKISDDLYRGEEDGGDVFDLELNTVFSYITSCQFTIYDKKRTGSSMIWGGTIVLKRK